ncbi:MAG: hypothetical protein GTO41_16695, partial [Burkholderiales bacterium]|nr:hypothetical protein [Burkholderiales bacterium]
FSESILARIHFLVYTDPTSHVDYDLKEIESRIIEAARTWQDDLRDALIERYGEEQGNMLFNRY